MGSNPILAAIYQGKCFAGPEWSRPEPGEF